MITNRTLGLLLMAAAATACVDDATPMPEPEPGTISYRRDVQPVWDAWCIGCHNFHTPHLVAAESAADLAGHSWFNCNQGTDRARFVVPGDPASSFLLYKLTGDNTNGYWDREACDRLMPADQNGVDVPLIQLDPAAVAKVRLWIEQGAVFD